MIEFEDILLEVGDYGKYQRRMIWFFLLPVNIVLPWLTLVVVLLVSTPEHWCHVPEVASSNLSLVEQKSLIRPPEDGSCKMFDVNYTEYIISGNYSVPGNTSAIPCQYGWDYDKTNYEATVSTQWNLVCRNDHYTKLIYTLGNVGSIIGTPIYGGMADKIGRKITFYVTVIVILISGISSMLVTDFTTFLVLRTINGTLMPSLFQIPFIILLEIVSPEMRTRMNGLSNTFWVVGSCILPLLAYFSRTWIVLGLSTASVPVLFFAYWKLLPESPRWLLSQERYDEALAIMEKIGEVNGKPQDSKVLLPKIKELGKKIKDEKEIDGVKNSIFDLLKYPQLRKKFIIITVCWIADGTAYYGLTINVENLEGNEFLVFFLLSLAEAPGYFTSWFFMERFGRRWCAVVSFILMGVSCILAPLGIPYGDVVFSMLGKYFSACSFMATYQQGSEIYPTVARSLGMGMSSTVASIITLVVPYIIYLSMYGKAVPFLIIGVIAILAGLSASFLPETLNENLPQTILDAENFGRNQKYFSWNRRKMSVSRERASVTNQNYLDPRGEQRADHKNGKPVLENRGPKYRSHLTTSKDKHDDEDGKTVFTKEHINLNTISGNSIK